MSKPANSEVLTSASVIKQFNSRQVSNLSVRTASVTPMTSDDELSRTHHSLFQFFASVDHARLWSHPSWNRTCHNSL